MMNVGRILIAGTVAVTLFLPAVSSGKEKPRKPAAKPGGATRSFSCSPLDLAAEKLPAGYRGQNIIGLTLSLARDAESLEKGEFEKEAQYRDRMAATAATPLPPGLDCGKTFTHDSLFAIVVEDGATLTYDPEVGDMKVSLLSADVHDSGLADKIVASDNTLDGEDYLGRLKNGASGIQVYESTKVTGSYVGQNAFGVKKRIQALECNDFRLAVSGKSPLREEYGGWSFALRVSAEKARNAKEHGKVLLIGNLKYPYIGKSKDRKTPKIDSPYDITTTTFYVVIDLREVWLYDKRTGEIYGKAKARATTEEVPETQ